MILAKTDHLSWFYFLNLLSAKLCLLRYWNDKDVLQKLGEAMGLAVSEEATTSVENPGHEEAEEAGNEDDSVVHQCASAGDVEVGYNLCLIACCLVCSLDKLKLYLFLLSWMPPEFIITSFKLFLLSFLLNAWCLICG